MNLVLTYCWREWRAQRSVLIAYTLLSIAILCLVFALANDTWWKGGSGSALATWWFVAIGVLGAVAFVAPTLVRGEYGAKDDQFVRRLPGALLPSFGGKLLFLALVTAAVPLLFFVAGQVFLLTTDAPAPSAVFVTEADGNVSVTWNAPLFVAVAGVLLAPWVWAIATWLPGGRMALGATLLTVLAFGFGVAGVLRLSPDIEKGIAWRGWLWAVPVAGIAVAAVSWAKGRRGGGPWRSARFGLAATAVALVPPSVWFADRTWHYHHPDLQRLAFLEPYGTSPTSRYVLARGAAHGEFASVPLRIDLADGSAVQIGGILDVFGPEVVRPAFLTMRAERASYWRAYGHSTGWRAYTTHAVLDLDTLTSTPVEFDPRTTDTTLPPELRARVVDEARATTPLRAPGGVRVWFDGGDLCFEDTRGDVERVRWEGPLPKTVQPCGHGFTMWSDRAGVFDLTARRFSVAKPGERLFVRGTMLERPNARPSAWFRYDAGESWPKPTSGLWDADVLGLFDDDHLLARSSREHLFLWSIADNSITKLVLPDDAPWDGSVQALTPFSRTHSLLPRDPRGRIWLWVTHGNGEQRTLVTLDAATRTLAVVPPAGGGDTSRMRLLGWPDADSALFGDGVAIVRVDVATGARTQLFPRR